ncbi:MAG: ATPase [Acidianus infernus]|nr:ATPase [Acidianus infernus]
MKILVNGLLPFDSGKTTFSLMLIRELKAVGIKLFPLKPVAGHNAWYSFNTLLRSYDLGILVDNDALKYYDETKEDIRKINPFAVLLSPVDLEILNFNVEYYNSLMVNGYPVMIRISCGNNDKYYATETHLIPKTMKDVLQQIYERFKPEIVSSNELRETINNSWYITESCIQHREDEIIESYNDASVPIPSAINVDYVFLVSPAKAFAIKGEEFRKVISLFSLPPWIIRTSNLIKYLKIEKSFDLEIFTSKNDKIIDYLIHDL